MRLIALLIALLAGFTGCSGLLGLRDVTLGDGPSDALAGDGPAGGPDDGKPPDARVTAYNYAFLSPVGVSGALGGLAAVDAQCGQWASAAGIPGTYRAILSTASGNASTRLAGARGWIRPDGRPVADLPASLFAPGMLAPVWLGPDGTKPGAQSVWSASGNTGVFQNTAGGTDCAAWTSASSATKAWYGFSHTTAEWLNRGTLASCDQLLHLYCFQVDHNAQLDIASFSESGRRMFVSSANFDVTTGIAGADALCAADAAARADLAGATFLAFLATNGASAASRFVSTAKPIVRLDGLRIADSFAALISQDLIHPPDVRISGPPYDFRVFTGASSPTSAGTAATTCQNWTIVGTSSVKQGFPESAALVDADRAWFNSSVNTDALCSDYNKQVPVYCLEK